MPEELELKHVKQVVTEVVTPVAAQVEEVKSAQTATAVLVATLTQENKNLKILVDEQKVKADANQVVIDDFVEYKDAEGREIKGDQPSLVMKSLTAQENELKSLMTNAGGNVRFQMKAVGPISLAASFGTDVLRGFRESGISSKPYNPRFILGLISTMFGGPGSNPISWVNRIPKEGGPAWTVELATKPNIDFTLTAESATAQFLAVWTEVTKQALLSMPMLEQEIYSLLNNEMMNKLEQDILTGTGVSPIIKGIIPYATAFAAGTLAGTVPSANIFDVIRAAIGQIYKANFFPNGVLVSIDTATKMDLTKDLEGRYLLPPFTTAEGTVIKGIRVFASNFVPADTFLVGDFTKYLFNFVEGLTIDIGYVDKQFIQNLVTLRAEIYGMGRVKAQETLAFVTGTFTSAITALNKPTT